MKLKELKARLWPNANNGNGFMMTGGGIWGSVFEFKQQQWYEVTLKESSVVLIPMTNWLLWKNENISHRKYLSLKIP